jgi:putative FmdB family regulatory protein
MPFYEYKCDDCGKVFTLLQSRSAERSGFSCPKCSGTQTERVFSTFASSVAGKSAADYCPTNRRVGCSHAGSCGCGHPH